MRSIVYNSYPISHLVIIIIIIIQSHHRIYYNDISTTQYNLTYIHCDSCPRYTFTYQILTHSPQLEAMIICPSQRNKCIYIRYPSRYNQRFKLLAWLNLKTRIHTHTYTPTPIYTTIFTTTHKRNLNGFFSAFCRIFDFCLYFVAFSIFNFIPSSELPDECCYKLQETLGCRTIFSMD